MGVPRWARRFTRGLHDLWWLFPFVEPHRQLRIENIEQKHDACER